MRLVWSTPFYHTSGETMKCFLKISMAPRILISYEINKGFPKSNDAANKRAAINIRGLG
jgi:hypothetical protein